MTIKALFFDFDGTLWDSERVALESWQREFALFGQELSLEEFAPLIGTVGGPDLVEVLQQKTGRVIDRTLVEERRMARKLAALDDLPARAGVLDYMREGRERGLVLAVVSTDDLPWITGGLRRLGLETAWDFIESADGDLSRAKPSPALYLSALERAGVDAQEAVALEDSPNGIEAATSAGIFCCGVPNSVTTHLDCGKADLLVESLADLPLQELIARAEVSSA